MAHYDALIAAWNDTTQPPTGVTGSGLLSTDTTAQKITKVNAWTVVGASLKMVIPTTDIYNAIVPSEFQALTAANQQLIRDILGLGTADASKGTNIRAVIIQVFPSTTTTYANLLALAKSYDDPNVAWREANGYGAGINANDCTNAGLT